MPDAPLIHALASGPPPCAIAVIRLSGAGCFDAVRQLTATRRLPPERHAMLRGLYHPQTQQKLDQALILIFPGPASFTGEDLAEIHCHGSIAAVAAVSRALALLGSRPAEPGEFTRRAFTTGRIDLTQAEALADLVAAETEAQRHQALANSGGRLRGLAEGWREALLHLMADVEARLDFADEGDVGEGDVGEGGLAVQQGSAAELAAAIGEALAGAAVAERVRHGLTIAVTGPPNVGKSSLVNALARREVAIVTPHAGTTRDVIEVHLDLAGRPAVLLDTAGLRRTDDPVEAEGIARAQQRAAAADLVLDLGPGGNIVNRIDMTGEAPGRRGGQLFVSALTGAGLGALEAWLADWATAQIPAGEPPAVTTARQAALLAEARDRLLDAAAEPDPVLLAEALRAAAHALGRLSGRIDPEAVLGAIFGRFCIGK